MFKTQPSALTHLLSWKQFFFRKCENSKETFNYWIGTLAFVPVSLRNPFDFTPPPPVPPPSFQCFSLLLRSCRGIIARRSPLSFKPESTLTLHAFPGSLSLLYSPDVQCIPCTICEWVSDSKPANSFLAGLVEVEQCAHIHTHTHRCSSC